MNLDLDFIYWTNVCNNLSIIFIIFVFIFGIAAVVYAIVAGVTAAECGWDDNDTKHLYKHMIRCIIITAILSIAVIFIPSTDYLYAKGIAENVSNNSEVIEDTINSTIKTIVEAVKEIKGEGSENK